MLKLFWRARVCGLAMTIAALAGSFARAADRPEIMLWPQGMPEPKVPADPPERVETDQDGISRRLHVCRPRLVVFQPANSSGKLTSALIVVPGGGFGRLADGHEGAEACEWLVKHGMTAFLLLHRTPTNLHAQPHAGPVQDVQQAVIEVRRRAAEFAVDAQKIGVLGFSAGGQAALIAATNPPTFQREPEYASLAATPDLLLLLYPYQIYDPERKGLRKEVGLEGPGMPTFIAQMGDDSASLPQGSAQLYLELVARKIPAELHIYETGGHGFGMRARPHAAGPTDWPARALAWLTLHGFLPPRN
ncbi:MAG: alpha/beta hydrolase [Planctomycetaceae bacterium]